MSILISDVRLPFPFSEGEALTAAIRKYSIPKSRVRAGSIYKRSLDLRHYTAQSLWDYIEEYQPDIVLDVRDDSMWLDETSPNSIFQ